MTGLLGIVIYALFAAVFFYVLFAVVRAAVLSALRKHAEEERARIATTLEQGLPPAG